MENKLRISYFSAFVIVYIHMIFNYLSNQAQTNPNQSAFLFKQKGRWESISYNKFLVETNILCNALYNNGISINDRIISISTNRPELNYLDMALIKIGAIHVAIHPATKQTDLFHIIEETEAKIIFVGNKSIYKLLKMEKDRFAHLQDIYCLDTAPDLNDLNLFIQRYYNEALSIPEREIDAFSTSYILYSSGTTGMPKGVMHSQYSMACLAEEMYDNYNVKNGDRVLSVASFSHAFERLHYLFYLKQGLTICYGDGLTSLPELIQEIKPHMMVLVPSYIEILFKFCASLVNHSDYTELRNMNVDFIGDAEQLMIHVALGGHLKQIITGAAFIPPYLVNFFQHINIPVYDCYGSTEATLHTININTKEYKVGTVGKTPSFAKLKIADDGEILIATEGMMQGYYKNDSLTKMTIINDWYHTGDIGSLDDDGFLTITGRKSILFKLINGKYLNPEIVEQSLKQYDSISNVLVYQDKDFKLSCIICAKQGSNEKEIEDYIFTNYNSYIDENEKIVSCKIIPEDSWSIENGAFTPTLKLKRKFIIEKFLN